MSDAQAAVSRFPVPQIAELPGSATTAHISDQSLTALLPDYNLAGSESAAGASAAGLIGAAVVLAAVVVLGKILKKAAQRHGSSASRD